MDYEAKARRVWTQIRSDTVDSGADPESNERESLHRPSAIARIAAAIREAVEKERQRWDAGLTRIASEHAAKREEYAPDQWGWHTHNSGDFTIREARDELRTLSGEK